jgi:hypothetical protein
MYLVLISATKVNLRIKKRIRRKRNERKIRTSEVRKDILICSARGKPSHHRTGRLTVKGPYRTEKKLRLCTFQMFILMIKEI